MTTVSCLEEIDDPLVLDASVVVNLNATGFADRVLDAIPVGVFIPDPVIKELRNGIKKGHTDATDLNELLVKGLVSTLKVPASAQAEYIGLVSGSATSSLGDGEAATIASAFAIGAWASIDERKARKICANRYPNIKVASTVDILSHPNVVSSLTKTELSAAILAALEVAHMQVHKHQIDWVINQLPFDRIENCISLPTSVRRAAIKLGSKVG
jgi:predicted nucleic acid-binding protein